MFVPIENPRSGKFEGMKAEYALNDYELEEGEIADDDDDQNYAKKCSAFGKHEVPTDEKRCPSYDSFQQSMYSAQKILPFGSKEVGNFNELNSFAVIHRNVPTELENTEQIQQNRLDKHEQHENFLNQKAVQTEAGDMGVKDKKEEYSTESYAEMRNELRRVQQCLLADELEEQFGIPDDGNQKIPDNQSEDDDEERKSEYGTNLDLVGNEDFQDNENQEGCASDFESKGGDGEISECETDLDLTESEVLEEELVEYRSSLDEEESDGQGSDGGGFCDEIVYGDEIISVKEFLSRYIPYGGMEFVAPVVMATENIQSETAETASKDYPEAGNIREMDTNFAEEVRADDRWIFESLGEPRSGMAVRDSERSGPEGLEKQTSATDPSKIGVITDISTCSGKEQDSNQIHKEAETTVVLQRKYYEEKKQLIQNIYSLLITARSKIADLEKENEKLRIKLQGNCNLKCPECRHILSVKKNALLPKYTKVMKGRFAIEMSFDSHAALEEWLIANNLEINTDGLAVVLQPSQQPTLFSSSSRLARKRMSAAGSCEAPSKKTRMETGPGVLQSSAVESENQKLDSSGAARFSRDYSDWNKENPKNVMLSGSKQADERPKMNIYEQRHGRCTTRTPMVDRERASLPCLAATQCKPTPIYRNSHKSHRDVEIYAGRSLPSGTGKDSSGREPELRRTMAADIWNRMPSKSGRKRKRKKKECTSREALPTDTGSHASSWSHGEGAERAYTLTQAMGICAVRRTSSRNRREREYTPRGVRRSSPEGQRSSTSYCGRSRERSQNESWRRRSKNPRMRQRECHLLPHRSRRSDMQYNSPLSSFMRRT